MSSRVLFLGGTGIISSACVADALGSDWEVSVLNRGTTSTRPVPDGVERIVADVRDADAVRAATKGRDFDVVADFLSFTPEHVRTAVDAFRDRTGQHLFISSASAYQTPPSHLPVTEDTPLDNPFWEYSRNKIACEELLFAQHAEHGLPVTVVRPSHTYDRTSIPLDGGWTVLERMRTGRPVVVPGDGSSLWTLTHARDFAVAFTGLLGKPAAIGEAFHITSDEALTWNEIFRTLGRAAGVEPELVHVASDAIAANDPDLGAGLLGDKSNTMIFDNSKVRGLVPWFTARTTFAQGAEEIVAWHDEDAARRTVDPRLDALFDRLVEAYRPRRLADA